MKPLSLSRPHLIIVVGIPGAGKTFFAEHFAATFKAPIVNEGKIQFELFGTLEGQAETEVAERAAQLMLEELVKTQKTIVYEDSSATRVKRQEILKYAQSVGYTPLLIWVQTDSMEANRRATSTRKTDGFLTDEQFDTAVRRFTIPSPKEKPIVISGKHTYGSQLRIVLKSLVKVLEGLPPRPAPTRQAPPEQRSEPRRNYIR